MRLQLRSGNDPVDAELNLPVTFAPSGIAETGPADVTVTGTVLARVAAGQCLVAPTRTLWCRMQWEEDGTQQYASFAGSLDEADGNSVFVGLPPTMLWSGSWRLHRESDAPPSHGVLDPSPAP